MLNDLVSVIKLAVEVGRELSIGADTSVCPYFSSISFIGFQ